MARWTIDRLLLNPGEALTELHRIESTGVVNALEADASFLDTLANVLDGWAKASETGGWSTHQVAANRDQANECRRRAAIIRTTVAAARHG